MLVYWGPEQLSYPNGMPAAKEDVLVTLPGSTGAVPLLADAAGTPLDNPVFTDLWGNLAFYVEEGAYDLVVNGVRIPILAEPLVAGDAAYVHRQATPAATWTVVHNLGDKPPVVLVLDGDLSQPVNTDVFYIDLNTISVEWPTAVSGYAYL